MCSRSRWPLCPKMHLAAQEDEEAEEEEEWRSGSVCFNHETARVPAESCQLVIS